MTLVQIHQGIIKWQQLNNLVMFWLVISNYLFELLNYPDFYINTKLIVNCYLNHSHTHTHTHKQVSAGNFLARKE